MSNLVGQPDATFGVANWVDYWWYGSTPMSANEPSPVTIVVDGSDFKANFDERTGTFTYALLLNTNIGVTAGTVYTAGFDVEQQYRLTGTVIDTTPSVHVRWYNSSGTWIDTSIVAQGLAGGVGRVAKQVTAPTGAVNARVGVQINPSTDGLGVARDGFIKYTNMYFGTYVPGTTDGDTPPPTPSTGVEAGLDVSLQIEDTTSPSNLVVNPSGADGAFGWVSNRGDSIISTTGSGDWTHIKATAMSANTTYYVSDAFPVDDTLSYLGLRILFGGHSADVRLGIQVEWLNVSQSVLGATGEEVVTLSSGLEYNKVVGGYAAGTEYARIRINQYHYTGTNGVPWAHDFFEFREATAKQSDTLTDVDNMDATDALTTVWIDIIEPSHEISIERDSVDVGLLTATVLKNEYDPAVGGFIKPGAAVRVRALANGTYDNIYQGVVNNVRTTYPRGAETRIFLTGSDAMTLLSNQKEPKGVATIAGLPDLLVGKGVQWSANGNANQVGAQTQVSSNDNASVFDQMVITRDSDKGYVWVDANNVVQMWNRASMPTAPVVTFSDAAGSAASYSDIDMGFDTTQTINVVEITYLQYNSTTGETTEVKYGPYIDADSLKTWGAYKSAFTIHGITESAANMQAFANEVLTKNATPTIKVNSITVPVRNDAERANAAAIDLYSMVHVTYGTRFNGDLRVTAIRHEITPDKWLAEYTFEKGDSVAIPVWTPSVNGA